jgi:hypothetical protein
MAEPIICVLITGSINPRDPDEQTRAITRVRRFVSRSDTSDLRPLTSDLCVDDDNPAASFKDDDK